MQCVAEQLESEGSEALMGQALLDAATRRLIGFEILTAPFVIAQLQMFLILSELGAKPTALHRPAVFLTNALTGWDGPEQMKLHFPELQAEYDAAHAVKRNGKIIVVIGNPPYNRFAGVPLLEEADLVDHYKGIRRDDKGKQVGPSELYTRWGIRKQLLDDLYIRFYRLAERCIGERAEYGVVSFISNYSFYAGRSHPMMRASLVRSFDEIWIDCLNGDKYKTGKVIPKGLPGEGTSDQSIFTTEHDPRGIQVGSCGFVSAISSRTGDHLLSCRVCTGSKESPESSQTDSPTARCESELDGLCGSGPLRSTTGTDNTWTEKRVQHVRQAKGFRRAHLQTSDSGSPCSGRCCAQGQRRGN
jgi:hypothetical protein